MESLIIHSYGDKHNIRQNIHNAFTKFYGNTAGCVEVDRKKYENRVSLNTLSVVTDYVDPHDYNNTFIKLRQSAMWIRCKEHVPKDLARIIHNYQSDDISFTKIITPTRIHTTARGVMVLNTRINMEHADLNICTFKNTIIDRIDATRFDSCIFINCTIHGNINSKFTNCTFKSCVLNDYIGDCTFIKCTFEGSRCISVTINSTIVRACTYDNFTFVAVAINSVVFRGCTLKNINVISSAFSNLRMTYSHVENLYSDDKFALNTCSFRKVKIKNIATIGIAVVGSGFRDVFIFGFACIKLDIQYTHFIGNVFYANIQEILSRSVYCKSKFTNVNVERMIKDNPSGKLVKCHMY